MLPLSAASRRTAVRGPAGRSVALALLAPLLAACGPSYPGAGVVPPGVAASGLDSARLADLEALWRARTDSARRRFTPADARFMTTMVPHHAQALTMAALVPSRTESADIRTLAARITNAQRDEIAIMQRWLRERDQPVPELHEMNGRLMVHGGAMAEGHADHAAMPGMLSEAQLDSLAAARGPAFDRLFLQYMIGHHRGAVVMVDTLFATDGAAQDPTVFRFASDVQVDQRTEVARMERMLAARRPAGDVPSDHPGSLPASSSDHASR